MKNIKKRLSLLIALALVASMMSACGGSDSSSASGAAESTDTTVASASVAETESEANPEAESAAVTSDAEPAASSTEEVSSDTAASSSGHKSIADVAPDIPMELPLTTDEVTFEYFTTLNPQITGYMSDLSENLYYQTAAELTGVNIKFVLASPDTQSENFQLMIAGGDYTDLIGSEGSSYSGGVELAVQDDVYVNILDYEEYAPHYFDLVTRDEYDYSVLLTDSGYMAGFGIVYTENQPLNQGYMIRQDWLDDLGLDTPTTYDQWYDVLCSFRDNYNCTPLALTGFSLSGLSAGFGVYGDVSSATVPVYVDDGTITFAWTQDGFRDYIQLMHDWYDEGLIDADELVNSAPFPDEDKIITDQRGIWKVERDNMVYYADLAQDSDFRAVAIQYPSMNEGETTHFKELTTNIASPALFLTTACENIPLLVQWVDFRYSEEGATLANYGTENFTFEYDDNGNPCFTDVIIDNPEGMTSSLAMNVYTLWRCECLYDSYRMDSTFSQDQRDAPDIWATNSDAECTLPSVTLTADEGERASSLYSDIYTYGAEHIVKFITGDEDMSAYDAFVEKLNSMNVDELTAIYQAAYDRYISR
jgi:putative aldouronate transport system substrate-binding protein